MSPRVGPPFGRCGALAGQLLITSVALLLMLGVLAAPAARAGVANGGLRGASGTNPLAGMPWGVYTGSQDELMPYYRAAQGLDRRLLGLVALRPRMRWFGTFSYPDPPSAAAREYIGNSTAGNPSALSQMAVFRMQPWEGEACRRLPTAAEQRSYRAWINSFASGIGGARVALVLQPDLPFASCAPYHSRLPLQLVSYAARRFSALPHTTVYLDAGASDWDSVGQAASLLRGAGVRYVRGFALGATHYASTADEVRFGAKVAQNLKAHGLPGKHFVINTAQNGRPFTYQQYHGPDYDNAAVCQSRSQQRCVTLGIPPTTNVAAARWRLPAGVRSLAQRYVDAYLWIGRPWLDNQADPFDLQRTLALASSTPF